MWRKLHRFMQSSKGAPSDSVADGGASQPAVLAELKALRQKAEQVQLKDLQSQCADTAKDAKKMKAKKCSKPRCRNSAASPRAKFCIGCFKKNARITGARRGDPRKWVATTEAGAIKRVKL